MHKNKMIVMEHEDKLLVRVISSIKLGKKVYRAISYQIWRDREKFKNNIPVEYTENGQYIYCSNYATSNEDEMIQTFKKMFGLNE